MKNLFHAQSFCRKSAARKLPKKYFVIFRLVGDVKPGIRIEAFTSNKPTHYLLDHGDNDKKQKCKNILFLSW